ncbi:MAG: site-specific recombinase Gcr [Moheibacter sp.]
MNLNSIYIRDNKTDKKFLSGLFQKAKKNYPDVITFIDALTLKLEVDEKFRSRFLIEIEEIFKDVRFIKYLTSSGLMQENSLFSILWHKITEVILPEIEDDQTLTSIVNDLFYNQSNYKNFKIIPKDRWERFYNALFLNWDKSQLSTLKKQVKIQLIESVNILMDRISGTFSDDEMMRYRPPGEFAETPFYKLSIDIRNVIENPDNPFDTLEIRQSIKKCSVYLNNILTQKDNKGISLKVTVKINRITQELQRLQEIIKCLDDLKGNNNLITFLSNASKKWPEYYSPRNWLSKHIRSTVYLVTFLATYHNGRTGEKYITTTTKEYFRLFLTACEGGLIVAICCYIKSWAGHLDSMSPFSKSFLYSINYALGFVAIYLFHMTLATKQPAMTASLIAHSLRTDKTNNEINYSEFAKLFARLSRSQIIAFVGNVLASFTLATVLFWLFRLVFNWKVLSISEALHYWDELAYIDPKIFWFASIAGFFLFVSGLISGLVINNLRYNNVPDRIYHHPFLKQFFGKEKRKKIANWFSKNYGGVVGNVVFGFLMGSAFLVGDFLDISFDIRHITFVAGNLAMGMAGIDYGGITTQTIITAVFAVFLVGWFNFIISFSLSLALAMRSNNIKIHHLFPMFWTVVKDFFKNPIRYFLPPLKRERII